MRAEPLGLVQGLSCRQRPLGWEMWLLRTYQGWVVAPLCWAPANTLNRTSIIDFQQLGKKFWGKAAFRLLKKLLPLSPKVFKSQGKYQSRRTGRTTKQMPNFRHPFWKWVSQLQDLQLPPVSQTQYKTETPEEGF